MEIRDTRFISWKDPYSWMEKMSGPKWNAMLKREKGFIEEIIPKRLANQFEKEFDQITPFTTNRGFHIGCGAIDVTIQKSDAFLWQWKWSEKQKRAFDIDVVGNVIWYTSTKNESDYSVVLICEDSSEKVFWEKKSVSSQVCIKNNLCYYIGTKRLFDTVYVKVCDAYTGKNEKVIYHEPDITRNLVLIPEVGKMLYFMSVQASHTKTWRIENQTIIQIDTDTQYQSPLGRLIGSDEDSRIVYDSKGNIEIRGKDIEKWIFPPKQEHPIWIHLLTGHMMTQKEGEISLWYCKKKKKPEKIFHLLAGDIIANPWTKWENTEIQTFYILCPYEPPYFIHVHREVVIPERNIERIRKIPKEFSDISKPLQVVKNYAVSLDKTHVPFVGVHNGNPTKLLVCGYGAYGSNTPIGWPHSSWYPILRRNWVVVYAFIRGGGDDGFTWASSAQKENRNKTIEDFEAVIRKSQEIFSISPSDTVIYGRSAGGFLVGSVLSRNPDGFLMKSVYTEVPFVDIISTLTNPLLPLTLGEHDEFGNPGQSLPVLKTLLDLSPMSTKIPKEGLPDIFVLARTGLKDQQVLAYEPFKWIYFIRGSVSKDNPNNKFILFEESQAHQYNSNHGSKARATDLSILLTSIEKKKNRIL